MEDYKIKIGNKLVTVSEEIYREYYRYDRRERYLKERSNKNELSYDALQDLGYPVEEKMAQPGEVISDTVITRMMIEKMLSSLKILNDYEQMIIKELYFNGKSERQLAEFLHVPRSTLQSRKNQILDKLKKNIEK